MDNSFIHQFAFRNTSKARIYTYLEMDQHSHWSNLIIANDIDFVNCKKEI